MSSTLFLGLVLGVLTLLVGGLFLRSGSALQAAESFPRSGGRYGSLRHDSRAIRSTCGRMLLVYRGGLRTTQRRERCRLRLCRRQAGNGPLWSGELGRRTDHAESIQITFDPSKISYGQLLKVFFSVAHDPTQLNRQGPDYGRQYRSEIFCADAEQKQIAEAYIGQLQKANVFSKPIVTEVSDLEAFYPAEEYHQDFVERNPRHPYVVVNAIPKVQKTKKAFSSLAK